MATAQRPQTPDVIPIQDHSRINQVLREIFESDDAQERLTPFMVMGQTYDRVAAQVRESMIRVPKIAQCDPNTIIDAVVTIQRWQLEIGETAFLVPYSNRGRLVCTPVRGYRGDIEILINNGVVRSVDARTVYEHELFIYEEGMNPKLEHHPLPPSKRGKVIGAYAIAWLTRSHAVQKFLWQEEIELHRNEHSKQWNAEQVPECPKWYGLKTAVKAATNLLPKTPKVRAVLEQMKDDEVVAESAVRGMAMPRAARRVEESGAVDEPTPKPETAASTSADDAQSREDAPFCPKCSGDMWDNRVGKTNPRAPDFKCKNKQCDGAIWPDRKKPSQSNNQGSIPGLDDPPPSRNAVAEGR